MSSRRTQVAHLAFVLDAFGDHAQMETVRHGDDGDGDQRVVRVAGDVLDKERSIFSTSKETAWR